MATRHRLTKTDDGKANARSAFEPSTSFIGVDNRLEEATRPENIAREDPSDDTDFP